MKLTVQPTMYSWTVNNFSKLLIVCSADVKCSKAKNTKANISASRALNTNQNNSLIIVFFISNGFKVFL